MGANPVGLPAHIRWLASEGEPEPVYVHIGQDGAERTATWEWLHRRSSQLAIALEDRGLGYGDLLGIGLRNSPEFVLSVFAAWKLGAVPVPVRWDVPDWELTRLRELIAPPVYLSDDDVVWIKSTDDLRVRDLPDVVSPHRFGICSSGSTGTPKVILSSGPAIHNPQYGELLADHWSPVPRPQNVLVLAPMYHVNAFSALNNLLAGDRLVALAKFDAVQAMDVIERHRVTNFTATPTMLQRMSDLPDFDERDLSTLVWITQGAAPMPPSLVHRWSELIGAERIVMAYGMTEGLGLTGLRGDEWMSHQGSVGRGLRDTEVRIMDSDGRPLGHGEIGDIYLRSPFGSYQYLGDTPPLPTTEDGFCSVGDVGYMDGDGYLFLVDRRVDMIVSGGANVFPAEVESALIDHPKVADVVVLGLRDPQWGRRVHALIAPSDPSDPPTADELVAYAKERLAPYKVPKSIEMVDSIARSEATKVNRGQLVEARGG